MTGLNLPSIHLGKDMQNMRCIPVYWHGMTIQPPRLRYVVAAILGLFIAFNEIAATAGTDTASRNGAALQAAQQRSIRALDRLVDGAMAKYQLNSALVEISSHDNVIYSRARGYSMSGVPATMAMHFRNGAVAFSYMTTLLLELADRHVISLNDKLAKFLPALPQAGAVTLLNLANMTSGYADYVYQPEMLQSLAQDPFRQWTPDELIRIGVSSSMQFKPGTNWAYCHTDYVILGRVLEMATHLKLADALERFVLEPMSLTHTRADDTPIASMPKPRMSPGAIANAAFTRTSRTRSAGAASTRIACRLCKAQHDLSGSAIRLKRDTDRPGK